MVTLFMPCALALSMVLQAEPDQAKLIDVKLISNEAGHSAFTDLVRFQDHWFLCFRAGDGHVSPNGALRVMTSTDGEKWESAARLTSKTGDLRDPKLSVTPDGRLMLAGVSALNPPSPIRHQSMVWFSKDGRTWTDGQAIGEPNVWIWRPAWHEGTAYGVGYTTIPPRSTRLYKSSDGVDYATIVPTLSERGEPNESALAFLPDDTALCLSRREGKGADGTAQLGRAKPPYTEWTWKDLGRHLGGPALIQLPDGRLLAGGRSYLDKPAHTALAWLDPDAGTLTEFLTLPSGGDNSYPGLVWHDGVLWVSYYSSHEGKTSVYLARVKLPSK